MSVKRFCPFLELQSSGSVKATLPTERLFNGVKHNPMEDRTGRTGSNRAPGTAEGRLRYAVDAGFLSGAHPNAPDLDDKESNQPASSDSESCDSDEESESPCGLANLAASFRVFSESLLRMERAQLEIAKAREASRLEAEKRRVESEAELTRMLLQNQLQIASFASRQNPGRKRKRVEENESPPVSEREGALLFGLIQCNLLF